MPDPFDDPPHTADLDTRIREIKRQLGHLGTELAHARATAPKTWTGKCCRKAKSFGAYDRGRSAISRCQNQIHALNAELSNLRAQARSRHEGQVLRPQPPPTINLDRYTFECPEGASQVLVYYGVRDNEMPAWAISRVRLKSAQFGTALAEILERQPGSLRLRVLD